MIFIINLLQFVNWLLGAYSLVVIASALISWVSPDPRNPIVRFLNAVTEPVLWQIRRSKIPTVFGGIDLAPLLLLLVIFFVQNVVISGLIGMLVGSVAPVR